MCKLIVSGLNQNVELHVCQIDERFAAQPDAVLPGPGRLVQERRRELWARATRSTDCEPRQEKLQRCLGVPEINSRKCLA